MPTVSWKWASKECHRLLALHLGTWKCCAATLNHNQHIGCLSRQNFFSTTVSLHSHNERQWSINDSRPCIMKYHGAVRLLWSINELLDAILGKTAYDNLVTEAKYWASMERQRFYALHLGITRASGTTLIHNQTIGRLTKVRWIPGFHQEALKITVNGVSTISCLPSWNLKGLWEYLHP